MARHRWGTSIPHLALCDRCALLRRRAFYPGGRGASRYYRASPEGETYVGSRAPQCEPALPSYVNEVRRAYFDSR